MTITPRVSIELQDALGTSPAAPQAGRRIYSTPTDAIRPVAMPHNSRWSEWERARFLEALELFPSGPWSHVAQYIGSKTAHQVMTHAQKHRQKLQRRQRREEELRRLQQVRLTPAAHASTLTEPDAARGLVDAGAEGEGGTPLSVVATSVRVSPAPVAVLDNEHQTNNEGAAVSNVAASLDDLALDDLLRWTDEFVASFGPTLTEFESLESLRQPIRRCCCSKQL